MPNGARTKDIVENYLLARIPFVSVRTAERGRVRGILKALSEKHSMDVVVHSLSQGMRQLHGGQVLSEEKSIWSALEFAGEQFQKRRNLTIVFTDVQHIGDDNEVTRHFADLVALAEQRNGCILVITAEPVWPQLQQLGMAVVLDPPDFDELRLLVVDNLEPYRARIPIEWDDADVDQAASILAGTNQMQAVNMLSLLLARRKVAKSDLAELSRAKDSAFSDLVGLQRVTVADGDSRVGGLTGLTAWLDERRPLLTMDLRDRRMKPPRGVLLVGVPGCGKSLSAKAVSARWELPLYRLDLGAVMGAYVGQSEQRLRAALETADTAAPCVLWIDEIEKGLAGAGTESTGVTTRLVGQFLFWLQESTARVFVVATANDVQRLPQELTRHGRFDAMFFVDLPDEGERREIIEIYLGRYLKVPVDGDLVTTLVKMSEGYSGAEIDAAVKGIGHLAILHGDENVPAEAYRRAFQAVIPLSRSAPDRIDEIRQMKNRAIPASGREIAEAVGRRVLLRD